MTELEKINSYLITKEWTIYRVKLGFQQASPFYVRNYIPKYFRFSVMKICNTTKVTTHSSEGGNTRATSISWNHLLPSNFKQKFTLRYTPIKEQETDMSLPKTADHNANVATRHKNNVAGMTHTGAGKPKQTRSITETRHTAVNLSKNDPVQVVQQTISVTRLCQYGRVTDCILHSEFRLAARSAALRSPQFPSDMSRDRSVLGQSITVTIVI
jgi:hypothetical protein